VFRGLGQPHKNVAVGSVQSALVIGSAWYLAGRYGLLGAGMAWLFGVGVSQIISAVFLTRLLPRPFASLAAPVTSITLCSIASATVALIINRLIMGLGGLVLAAFLALLSAVLLLWFSDRHFHLGLLTGLLRAFPQIANLARLSPYHS
jgi:O-antigen/teichoic acid export membrane protein